MKKRMIFGRRILAAGVSFFLAAASINNCYAEPDTEQIESGVEWLEISSLEDLETLAENCRYDSFSLEKYFRLTADIDVSGSSFSGIAYFAGIFDGQGHTISGLRIKEKGSDYGLFRYIGENGMVSNLTVKGVVDPEGSGINVGGITGVNYGQIVDCTFSGEVRGQECVGAVAGVNKTTGIISGCSSQAEVLATDYTGGIAGRNEGLISGCTSESSINMEELETSMDVGGVDVGMLNLTQNVIIRNNMGGIAGSSNGIIADCSNKGTVGFEHTGYNVGGIAGMQSGMISKCTNTGKVYGRKDVGGIVGQAEPYVESEYLEDKIDETQDSLNKINQTLNQISAAVSQTSEVTHEQMDALMNQYQDSEKDAEDQLSSIRDSIGETNPEAQESIDNINQAMGRLDELSSADGDLSEEQLQEIQDNWEIINSNLSELENQTAASEVPQEQIEEELAGQLKAQQGYENVETILDALDFGIQSVTDGVNSIVNQIENINNNFDDSLDAMMGEDAVIEDISSIEMADQMHGVISGCVNRGTVYGDLNAGGIAGTMNIEYDIDPEYDVDLSNSTNVILRTTVSDIITACINYGAVETKRNCGGGITGLQELGLIYQCEGYGYIRSDDGEYLGGIAGQSDSTIHTSYSLCSVYGKSYSGGICGLGYQIENCISISSVYSDGEAAGSIAGCIDEEGKAAKNYFVSEKLGGIDNINYSGSADMISYEEALAMEGIPEGFNTVTVTFETEDGVIGSKTAAYGGNVLEQELPEIPKKEGFYGVWDLEALKNLTENITVRAEYIPWTQSLASEACAEDGRPLVLVLGEFDKDTVLKLHESSGPETEGEVLYSYGWKILSENEKSFDTMELHFYSIDKGGTNEIWYLLNGNWQKVQTEEDGSYLTAQIPYGAEFALIRKPSDYNWIAVCAAAAVLIVFLIIMVSVIRRKEKRKQENR